MRRRERIGKVILVGALVLAMGVTTLSSASTKSYAASGLSLNKTSRNILTRHTYDFDVVGASDDAVVTWKSSNKAVATVDEDGVVTGVTKGKATITCTVKDGGETTKLTAKVSIRKPAVKIVIKNKIKELDINETYDLNRTLTPGSSNDVTTWKTSNKSVATVDKNGVVTPKKNGKVTITATTMSGKTDSVEIAITGTKLSPDAPKPTQAPKPTEAPKPTQAPVSKDKTFKISGLTPYKGYGYSMNGVANGGTEFIFEGQYQEVFLSLPEDIDLSLYDKAIVTASNATDDLMVKFTSTYEEANQYGNPTSIHELHQYRPTGKEKTEIDLSAYAGKKVNIICFSAQNAACSAVVYDVTFVSNGKSASSSATTSATKYDVTKLQQGGYGYEMAGNKVSLSDLYQEVQFTLPKELKAGDYKELTVSLANVTDTVAVKLLNASGELIAVYYNVDGTSTFDLSKHHGLQGQGADVDPNAKIAKVAIMANKGACSAEINGIEFK